MLANAFEALKTYDWGTDLAALAPIEDAAVASHNDAPARHELENHLIAALKENLSRDAHDYVCRKLTIVGTAAAVPVLAGQLADKEHSHMARYALERMPEPAAGKALRDALGRVNGDLKIGVISSLGARRDAEAVAPLASLLKDKDVAVAAAAAQSLGAIGTAESAKALQANLEKIGDQQDLIDALLTCADALLASNKEADAMSIFKSLSGEQHGRLVRLAATRGILACAGKTS